MSKKLRLTIVLAFACLVLVFFANETGVIDLSKKSTILQPTVQAENKTPNDAEPTSPQKKYRYECWSSDESNKPRENQCYFDRNLAEQERKAHEAAYPRHKGAVLVTSCE